MSISKLFMPLVALTFGLFTFVSTADAALPPNKDALIKASGDAVYYYASDGKRYVFPNQKTYSTWFSDFGDVVTVTDAELASAMIGGNVTYRPGIRMIKITSDPKVYAVDQRGVLRWVSSEAVAIALYGTDWNKHIDDVSDAFFINYTMGSPIESASDFDPRAAANAETTINADKGIAVGPTPKLADTAPPDIDAVPPNQPPTSDTGDEFGTTEAQYDTWRRFALNHINQLRAEDGKGPVIMNEMLNDIADAHSRDMGLNLQTMSHDGSLGEQAHERIKQGKVVDSTSNTFTYLPYPANIGWSGENVGRRYTGSFGGSIEDAIVDQHLWFMDEPVDEPNHRTTMLSTLYPFSEVGIGLFLDQYGVIWITEDYISIQ